MIKVEGGICAPKGYKAGAAMAGVKYANKYDIALIVSEVEAAVAGVFTTNKIQSPAVVYSKQVVTRGTGRGIVVNSGNANTCNGKQGMADCVQMAETAAEVLGVETEQIAVASTGVIGLIMPMDRVTAGIRAAGKSLSIEGGAQAALAIMTTDTRCKEIAVQAALGETIITVGGMCKGSGMIHPNMATMLGFITTDADIDPVLLQQQVREAVAGSFNMVSIDGDSSTNDMVLALANGMAGNQRIVSAGEDMVVFRAALDLACQGLAQMIAKDGEGATKYLEVEVAGAGTLEDARVGARAIISSNLVKTAFYGEDANWGRIICALGYSGADFAPELVDIYLGDLPVAKAGQGLEFCELTAKQVLSQKDIKIRVELNQGQHRATAWGCDLSHEYVSINAEYRT